MTIGSDHVTQAKLHWLLPPTRLRPFPMAPMWPKKIDARGHGHGGHGQGTFEMAAKRVFFGSIPAHLKDADFERMVLAKIGPMEHIKASAGRSLGRIG